MARVKPQQGIQLGGLIVKTGLDHLDQKVLLGALLEIKSLISKDKINSWQSAALGEFNKNSKLKVHFKQKPDLEILNTLKNLGFCWDKENASWIGFSEIKFISSLVEPFFGKVERVFGD